jgi:hypothetical protein
VNGQIEPAEWGRYLAGLPPPQRDEARSAARKALELSLPDDEIEHVPVRSLGEYIDQEIVLPPMLVHPGLVARGAVHVMYARAGKGKTAVSLNRVLRWGAGLPLFDELPDVMKPEKPLRTLIIENEGAPGHFQQKLTTILNGLHEGRPIFSDEEREATRANVHIWGDGGWSKMKLDQPGNLELVKRGVEKVEADIVFLEPFRGLWSGDEQDSTAMSKVLDALSELANEFNCGVMLTHHERKSNEYGDDMDAARGSTAFEAQCAVMERWRPVASGRQRELKWTKNRFVPEIAPVRMRWEQERWGYSFVAENEHQRDVMAVLHAVAPDWTTVGEVADELGGENQQNVRRWLNKAADEDPTVKKRRRENQWMYRVSVTEEDADYSPLGVR